MKKTRTEVVKQRVCLWVAGAMATFAPALFAQAQSGTAPAAAATTAPSSSAAANEGLEEIVVTADKKEVSMQRAAISITAIGAGELETRAITDPAALNGIAPAVEFQTTFELLTYIRGIGNYSSQPGVDQSVAYNVDGVYISKPFAMPNILFDQARIEILRGPQGTLEGRNSTGGSVNLVANAPSKEFEGNASVQAGNYGLVDTGAMINLPISDKLFLRIAGATSDHNGYLSNGYDDAHERGGRMKLLALPTENVDILLTAEYTEQHGKGQSLSLCPPGTSGNTYAACAGVLWKPFSGTPGQGTDAVNNIDEPNSLTDENSAFYGEINWHLGWATLTWVPSYRYVNYRDVQTYTHEFGYTPAVRNSLHSEEIRLGSVAESAITWVGGFNYGREHSDEQNYFQTGAGPSITVTENDFPTVGHVYDKFDVSRYIYQSTAAFGQATWPVMDKLRVVTGGRFTHDEKSLDGSAGIVSGTIAAPVLTSAAVAADEKKDIFTYKLGLEYDVLDNSMVYGNFSTGYKAGGVNAVPPGSGFPTTYEPERIKAYQVGSKNRFLDNTLQVNAEAFYYDYRNYQTSGFAETADGIELGLNVNSQKARFYGGEIETKYLATPDDKIDLSIALLSAVYTEFVVPSTGVNLSGQEAPNAPKFTADPGFEHDIHLPNGGMIALHSDARYASDQWVDYRHSDGSHIAGYWRANADANYHAPDSRYTIGAWIRNIGNNGSYISVVSNLGPQNGGLTLPPRTYGVRVSVDF